MNAGFTLATAPPGARDEEEIDLPMEGDTHTDTYLPAPDGLPFTPTLHSLHPPIHSIADRHDFELTSAPILDVESLIYT